MKILVFYNPFKISLKDLEEKILKPVKDEKIEILGCLTAGSSIENIQVQSADYFIVFGGDGTVLKIAQIAAYFSKPIIAVNIGNLGFLSAYSSNEMEELLQDIKTENIYFSIRNILECHVGTKDIVVLNDVVLLKSQPLGTMDIEVKIQEHVLFSFLGDGIILSTSTGSTAYALSAGGPIIDPNLNIIEIVPLAPHALNIRPFITFSDQKIEILLKNMSQGFAYLTGDGDIIHRMEPGMSAVISGSKDNIKLAQRNGNNYYNALNKKLGFGRRFE
ncbi:NAD(+)/NADH kinase [Petrotoga sp. 9PWA.NaAc.5.4]|uniref:NAD(+)/NADH kinase n=1 Tax=Petrotoga sp. 9PWA.NaAc.5.4 TaxID=1434328 RepID=UPI000CB17706|nr:NAD(+)/NADH kinase [Petrotoga sp. 9PWA.NaAc.5.4]PNR95291.1 inorganic polyphosphate/ATP-NAD kinase [Petrotoga sp. 9PWA.NaAc.5.4]